MLTAQEIETFHKDGFLVIPGVFSKEEFIELRSYTESIFHDSKAYPGDITNHDELRTRANLLSRYPKYLSIIKNKKFISAIKSILGDDFIFLPEISAHQSGYGGWHKDTDAQEKDGYSFHWHKDYLMLEAAIYLQPNGKGAGGLDVEPGSHMKPKEARRKHSRVVRWLKKFGLFKSDEGYSIPTQEGDLLLFHYRINHRATQRKKKPDITKMALFFACSKNNEHAEEYLKFIHTRKDYIYLADNPLYTKEVLDVAKNENLNFLY